MDNHEDNSLNESQALPPLPENDIDKAASDGVNDSNKYTYNDTPLFRKEPNHKICIDIRHCMVTGMNCLEDPNHPNSKAKIDIWAAEDNEKIARVKDYEDAILLKYLEHQNSATVRADTSESSKKRGAETQSDTKAEAEISTTVVKKHKIDPDTTITVVQKPPHGTTFEDWHEPTHRTLHAEDWERLVLEKPMPFNLRFAPCGNPALARGYGGSSDGSGNPTWPGRRPSPQLTIAMPVPSKTGVLRNPFPLSKKPKTPEWLTSTSKGLAASDKIVYRGARKQPSAINTHAPRNANGRIISTAPFTTGALPDPTNLFASPETPKQDSPSSIMHNPLYSKSDRTEMARLPYERWEVESGGVGGLVTWPEVGAGSDRMQKTKSTEAGLPVEMGKADDAIKGKGKSQVQSEGKGDWVHVNDDGKQMDTGAGWELM
jgi:hypothetical protein